MTAGDETGHEPPSGELAATRRDFDELDRAHDDRLYEIWLSPYEKDVYTFGYRYSSDQRPVLLEALLIVLRDDAARPRDRAFAGRILGLMRHPEAFEPLMAMLAEPRGADQSIGSYYHRRNNVIRALGDLGDPRAVPALIDALADQGGVPGGDAMIYVYYEAHESSGLRRVPWRRCCKVKPGRHMGDVLVADQRPAKLAAESLGEIGSEQAVPALIDVLQDRSRGSSLRFAAGEALGQIGDPGALPALRALREDRSESSWFRHFIRPSISHTQSRMKTPEQLVSDLGSEDAAAVCFAIDRLVRLGEETAVPALAKLYDDPRMFMFPGRPRTRYTIRYLAREAVRDIGAGHAAGS